ncbi:MAG: fibronectin type III domain-containing protein [Acidobacteriota bacterium]
MSAKKTRLQESPGMVQPKRRRKTLIAIAVGLSLLAGGAALALRGGSVPQTDGKEIQVVPAGLTPGSPSKEYIYAGGRLIATEEPPGVPTPPAAPTGLAATAGNAQVSLSWNASSGATSYNVKRSTTNGGPYSTIAPGIGTTSYLNTGLTNGTTYYYVVSASNGAGEGPNSSQVSATPIAAPTPPAAPTGLTATPGNAQVSLSWNASSGATSYNVKRSTINGGPYSTIAPGIGTTSYLNTGLTNGTTYYYVVSASNGAGEGLNSSQVSATPTAGGGLAPTLSNMSPATAIQGASFTLTINGSNLAGTTSINLTPPDDVTFTNISSTASQITCSMSIGAAAAVGGRNLKVTTATGGESTNALTFGILSSSPAPTISSISPVTKAPGTTFTLTINGTNLSQTTSVNFNASAGITVSNMIVVSSVKVTATITISSGAATGSRQVSVTTPFGTSNPVTYLVQTGR